MNQSLVDCRSLKSRTTMADDTVLLYVSYFPGYSWTITYCSRCASLLGWKFRKVNPKSSRSSSGTASENQQHPDRPSEFFGFMSSSIVTIPDSSER